MGNFCVKDTRPPQSSFEEQNKYIITFDPKKSPAGKPKHDDRQSTDSAKMLEVGCKIME